MEPIQFGVFTIYPLGLFIAVLLVPFFLLVSLRMKKNSLKRETVSWYALLAIPLCLIFARLAYCLVTLDELVDIYGFGFIFRIHEGGFLLWGAICGALLAAKCTGKITKQSGAVISDSAIVSICLMIAAIRLLCGLLFNGYSTGLSLENWFAPEETDFSFRFSVWPLADYSFFERFPFAIQDYYGDWCWAIFVLQALWAIIVAGFLYRSKSAPGGKTVKFIILYACGSMAIDTMLFGGSILYLPWVGFAKTDLILCAVALIAALAICIRRLPRKQRLKPAILSLVQFICCGGLVTVVEFAAFEKRVAVINWLPADGCHLIAILACLWMYLVFRSVWKKAYAA